MDDIKTIISEEMKKYTLTLSFALLLLSCLVFTPSCKKEKVPAAILDPNCSDTISFTTQIAPMISNNCASCHSAGNGTGYTLTNHTNISSNASDILNAIQGNGVQLMPQGGPALNDSLIQQFSCWLSQGTLDN